MKKLFLSLFIIGCASLMNVNAQSSVAVSSTDQVVATEAVSVTKTCHDGEAKGGKACCSKDKAEAKSTSTGDKATASAGKACCAAKTEASVVESDATAKSKRKQK